MSDEYPGEEPGTAAPTWAAVPTMPWGRVPEQRRDEPDGGRSRGPQPPHGEQHPRQQTRSGQPPRGGYEEPRDARESRESRPNPRQPFGPRPESQGGRPPVPEQGGRQQGGADQGGYGRPAGGGEPREYGRPPEPGGRPQPGPDQGGYGRPAPGNSYGHPRSRALDEPTDEVPRVRRDARRAQTPGSARPSGRASVGGPPAVTGGRGAAVYGTGAPAETGRGSTVYGAPPAGGREYGGPANAPMSAPPSGREYGGPANAPMSAPPSGREYGTPPGQHEYGAPDNAPMSAPPSGREYNPLEDDLPGPVEQHPDAPVSGMPVSAAPASSTPAGHAPGIQVQFVDVGDPAHQQPPPPAVAAGMGSYRSAPLTGAGVDGLQATGYLPIVRPGKEGFPPELAALAPTSPPAPRAEPADAAGADPEQVLASYVWRFDPDTLREQIEGTEVDELNEIRDLLTAKLNGVADNPTRARLLSLRAVVSRILNDLPKAFADGKLALAHAEATGELRRIAIAQARLAHVLQWREEFEEADRLFTLANSSELPDRLRATMHQHAGKCAYDQGRYMEACNHFERALDLRKEEDPELIAQTELALDAVFRRVAEKGWGPYPRTRDEILQIRKSPAPAFDEQTQRWGYIHPDGNFCIGPGYLDVQPFRDGVAWVQRQGSQNWELIDDSGRVVIEPAAGYVGVGLFSDGIAWVSRDGTTRWIAIDKTNAVLISTGYDDVRPFRRGVAAVRRGQHWGAVDGVGRVVVSFQYDGFATALLDGRYIDGFSDEGLAVVSLDGRKGVVDRSGRVLVPPIHHTLMIHPVAFLIADDSQRWGALDRRGRTVIEATFPSRTGVTDEIDRLLADTRPVM